MRRVPSFLIIGNGRVSHHFQHYFSLLNIPYLLWHRQKSYKELQNDICNVNRILLLINDDVIESFIFEHLKNYQGMLIHFSGSLVTNHAIGVHPLMTFNESQYALLQYQEIPFVIDHDAPDFELLLPTLVNPHVRLHKSFKSKYHALCVMSGNFSCLLWQKLFMTLENEFNIPSSMAHAYLLQQTNNLITSPKTALTGPLVRGDRQTMMKHMDVLSDDPFQKIYEAFVQSYQREIR